MQTIQLQDASYEKLSQQAAAAGYVDLASYIESLVEEAAFDLRCGMSDAQLRQSARECDQINERMKSQGGHDARESLAGLGKKLGFGPTG